MKTANLDPGILSPSRASERSSWMAPVLLFVIAILLRLPSLALGPTNDEIYTVLAARGWLLDGVPRIADGLYPRAELFTILVAQFFGVMGESSCGRSNPFTAGW